MLHRPRFHPQPAAKSWSSRAGVLCACAALLVGACANDGDPNGPARDRNNKAIGAGVGAAAGAAIGAAVGGDKRGRNAGIGAGAGALAGLAIGAYMDAQERKLRERLSGTGVAVVREGDEILLRVPNDLTFDVDRADLQPSVRESLTGIAETLQDYPETIVRITGHADATGSDAYNLQLSERRAQAVAQFLGQQGVAAARLSAVGRGETVPIASNATPEDRARNRRVEIRLVPQPA
jgi:outer membrane protein OmpA-like peptidoglycan-associated protein